MLDVVVRFKLIEREEGLTVHNFVPLISRLPSIFRSRRAPRHVPAMLGHRS